MGGARFGQPSAVPGFIPPQQQWVQPQQVQPGMMGGVQQMPTQQFWGQLLQPGSHWVAGGQFVGGMVQLAGFAGAQPQQPLGGFASVPQQQPQQLMQANAGGGQQQHPVSQSFVGGGVQHPQQPPPPTGGATNPFAVSHTTCSSVLDSIIMFICFHSLAAAPLTLFYDAVHTCIHIIL